MGEVYRACDAKLDRPVALKLLPARVAHDPEWLRRFRAEARPRLRSTTHISSSCMTSVSSAGRPFIVMEFVEGQTLRARVDAATRRQGGRRHHDGSRARSTPRTRAGSSTATSNRKRHAAARRVREGAGLRQRGSSPATKPRPSLSAAGTLVGTLRYHHPNRAVGAGARAERRVLAGTPAVRDDRRPPSVSRTVEHRGPPWASSPRTSTVIRRRRGIDDLLGDARQAPTATTERRRCCRAFERTRRERLEWVKSRGAGSA